MVKLQLLFFVDFISTPGQASRLTLKRDGPTDAARRNSRLDNKCHLGVHFPLNLKCACSKNFVFYANLANLRLSSNDNAPCSRSAVGPSHYFRIKWVYF
jgi:hypothetical protein